MSVHAKLKVDTVSTSDEKIMREFVTLGQSIGDKPVARLIQLAILVKAMFAAKPRGVPIFFDGRPYMEFDDFVDATMPISGRTMRRWLANEGETDQRFSRKSRQKRYFLTPPELYEALNKEFGPFHDPCPLGGTDGLTTDWGESNYVNPPFRAADGVNGGGPTAFARKAIEEQKKGKTSVLVLPVQNYVDMLLRAGAELRPLGRVKWLEADSKEAMPGPTTVCAFILRGKGLAPMPKRHQYSYGQKEENLIKSAAGVPLDKPIDAKERVKYMGVYDAGYHEGHEDGFRRGQQYQLEYDKQRNTEIVAGEELVEENKHSDEGNDWGEVKKKS